MDVKHTSKRHQIDKRDFPQMQIGKKVKERLEIPENRTIVFNVHKVEILTKVL